MAAPPNDPGLDPLRAGAAALAAVLLVAVVVLAAGAGGPAASTAVGRDASDPLATLLFVLGAIWLAAMLVASPIVSGLTLVGGPPKQRRWHGGILAAVLLISILLVILALAGAAGPRGDEGETGPDAERSRDRLRRIREVPRIDAADIDWLLVTLVFGAALVAFGIVAALIVRPRGRSLPELQARQLLDAVLEETLDDLRSEPDPRRAVIGAYARMERSLGAYGLPRRPSEAPLEYLARVITELTGGGTAARRLTRLFERAKFSEHAIDAAMKEDAIEAVAAVRQDLRVLTVA